MSFVQITDHSAALMKRLAEIAGRSVQVGIFDSEEAVIAYVQNYGSAARNIPPQHFFDRGIEAAEPAIAKNMGDALLAAMDNDPGAVDKALGAAGQAAVSEIKAVAPVRTGKLRDSVEYKLTGTFEQSADDDKENDGDDSPEGGESESAGEDAIEGLAEAGEAGIAEAGEAALLL